MKRLSAAVLTLLLGLLAGGAAAHRFPNPQEDLKTRYEALVAASDGTQLAELFRAGPGRVLPTIDSDLEGALALLEQDPSLEGSERVAALHSRALYGARVADGAFASVLFSDYASAFAGWTQAQRADFRAGQRAFGEHRRAMAAGDLEAALAQAVLCRSLAEPLGDHWGTAMGLAGEGAALLALGRAQEAVAPLARARVLNHGLRLEGAEYAVLRSLGDALIATGAKARARNVLERALSVAQSREDSANAAAIRKQLEGL